MVPDHPVVLQEDPDMHDNDVPPLVAPHPGRDPVCELPHPEMIGAALGGGGWRLSKDSS